MKRYFVSSLICRECKLKTQCTTGLRRKMTRWEHEEVLEKMQEQLDQTPAARTVRAQTVEHPFGTLKLWMGARLIFNEEARKR